MSVIMACAVRSIGCAEPGWIVGNSEATGLAIPKARMACSIESIRKCTPPICRANSRAIAVFPVAGRLPKTTCTSDFDNYGT